MCSVPSCDSQQRDVTRSDFRHAKTACVFLAGSAGYLSTPGWPRVNPAFNDGRQGEAFLMHIRPNDKFVSTSDEAVVVYAADATIVNGDWQMEDDQTAAAARVLRNPNRARAEITAPAAAPANYVEIPFTAKGGVYYHVWLRGFAENDSVDNDSVWIQFSDSIDSSGAPMWRIGSTSGTAIAIEDCRGCGVRGWGWQDNGYGRGVFGPVLRFASTGRHTIRLQQREDGIAFDQILLTTDLDDHSPGALKDDAEVWARSVAPPASGTVCGVGEVVIHMTGTTAGAGKWQPAADSTAASQVRMFHPDAGAPKITSAQAAPANYFEKSFAAEPNTDYRLWIRGRAQNDFWGNDSVFVQFNDSVNASAAPIWRIGSTSATDVNLEDCSGCGLKGRGWQDNGWGVGVMGPLVRFATRGTHTIRIQTREDGFSIDQIALSSGKYLSAAPGSGKNDVTILPACPSPPLR